MRAHRQSRSDRGQRPLGRASGTTWLMMLALIAVGGCQKPVTVAHDKAQPAKVTPAPNEQNLNIVTLSEQADQRLGIRTAEVRLASVQPLRNFAGEMVVPPGQTIAVFSPMAGTLNTPGGEQAPFPGSKLAAGQVVFQLTPLLTPERDVLTPVDRINIARTKADFATAVVEAQRGVESAKVQVDAAQIAYNRAAQLLEAKAGSQRSVDEAATARELARESLATAEARYRLISGIRWDDEAGELKSRPITAPVAGVLQSIEAAPGETVTVGMELFRLVILDRLWIRVPVYVGYWREIDTEQPASIAEYGQHPQTPARSATYVSAPPSADPLAASVDLFYALDNRDGQLCPGQKLSVSLPLKSPDSRLVLPWSAVLYDIQGGSWVYEQTAPCTYVRRRVEVEYVRGTDAVLASGPGRAAKVVAEGAAELFGTEFGVGK